MGPTGDPHPSGLVAAGQAGYWEHPRWDAFRELNQAIAVPRPSWKFTGRQLRRRLPTPHISVLHWAPSELVCSHFTVLWYSCFEIPSATFLVIVHRNYSTLNIWFCFPWVKATSRDCGPCFQRINISSPVEKIPCQVWFALLQLRRINALTGGKRHILRVRKWNKTNESAQCFLLLSLER